MVTRDEMSGRLAALGTAHHIPDDVRRAHRAAIGERLASRETTPVPVPWRLRLAAAATAAVVAVPVAAAASSDALPGEALYPLKRAVEPAWSLLDARVEARHRVAELAALLAAADDDERTATALAAAGRAVESLAPDDPLRGELDGLVAGSTPAPARPDPALGPGPAPAPPTTTLVADDDGDDPPADSVNPSDETGGEAEHVTEAGGDDGHPEDHPDDGDEEEEDS